MNRINPIRAVLGRIAVPCAAGMLILALPSVALGADVRLMVDAGHGGKDPGAVGGPVKEKNSNLAISKLVVKAAKRQGWSVAMTRKDDRFIPLDARPAKAKKFRATATVSIHSNSAGSKKTGNMTIYRGTKSKRLGNRIMEQLAPMTPYKDIGNRKDSRGLAVLRGASSPTVIVEVLSVSNKQENARLRNPEFQRETAEAIVKGVAHFHGVDYRPPVVKKEEPASKAAPAAETTAPAPLKATPTALSTERAEKLATSEKTAAEKPATAGEPRAERAEAAERTDAPARRSSSRRIPLGETSWIGLIISMIAE